MITISITPINEYTCQGCKKTFTTNKDYKITQNEFPICSSRCKFKVIYRLLTKFGNSELKVLFDECYRDEDFPETRSELIYALTKFFSRWSVSSLNSVSSNEHNELSGQKVESNTNNYLCEFQ